MKKMILGIIISIFLTVILASNVFAANLCFNDGCSRIQSGDKYYCSLHACQHGKCKKGKVDGSKYCVAHTCKNRRAGCYNEVSSANEKCSKCKNKEKKNSTGSYSTSKGTSNSKSTFSPKKSNSYKNSYDEGYEDIWLDDDYDWDRYYRDDDYAAGVDDAMDDEDW